ncbi:MAG: hypothetical protein QOG13_3014 [Sphingomonadales bacterium]|jgi:hypothetical protein|nr:hypothetical protein [Sphingomonadales bacterium]MEA3045197.1 hypothetical protein [Sphingomonadales bacterium]
MKPSPLLLMLDALLGLVEQRLQADPGASAADLLPVGRQLHRLNGLYIRLVESAMSSLPPPHEPDAGESG